MSVESFVLLVVPGSVAFQPNIRSYLRLQNSSANLLHCRSPFNCARKHVDNLGAAASRPRPAFSSIWLRHLKGKTPCNNRTTLTLGRRTFQIRDDDGPQRMPRFGSLGMPQTG